MTSAARRRTARLVGGVILVLGLLFVQMARADIDRFVGSYSGSAQLVAADGSTSQRDMSVTISTNEEGFTVQWTSVSYKSAGRTKTKSYSIDFRRSDREGVFAAAMRTNLFGKAVQMDPMRGEPYVWGRIIDDTLTVFSLFVDDGGGYELQQFDRRLAPGGLDMDFKVVRNGEVLRTASTFLTKQ